MEKVLVQCFCGNIFGEKVLVQCFCGNFFGEKSIGAMIFVDFFFGKKCWSKMEMSACGTTTEDRAT